MRKQPNKRTIKVWVDFKPKATEHINAKLAGIGGGGFHATDRRPSRSRAKAIARREIGEFSFRALPF